MSVRRALVDCAVLSLQDACVFYPCCKGCFSRIDVEEQDGTRCRCSRCGYRCLRERVDYRYRLSLRVVRDRSIFGVTVFGNSLNPFFGIHASGLQRLVENSDGPVGPNARSTLLVKAVEDCFIGRHFIFGIKVTETEGGPWSGGPVPNDSNSKDSKVQFVASQMILPKAPGLSGCTVVSYYRMLLQKASEYEPGSADPSKIPRLPATPLLLIPGLSATSSFNDSTLFASDLLSQSPQRSEHQDSSLTPTPPWQQSLGLVTSSAEQEEGCSTQHSGHDNSRHTDNSTTPHPAQRGCLESCEVTDGRSPLLPLEHSVYSSPSFAKYPRSSIKEPVGNSPNLNTWSSPSQPGHKRCSSTVKEVSTRQLTRTYLSSSLAWEDLPFSESLSEFLCAENKDFDFVSVTEANLNVHNQKETARNNLEITNLTTDSTSACQRNTQKQDSHIRNTPGQRHDLSGQVCENPVACLHKSQARGVSSCECNQEDEEASSLSPEKEDGGKLEGDTYNCSADLFSGSFMTSMNTETLNTTAGTVRTTAEACPLFSKPDQQENTNAALSTPNKQKLKRSKCNRDSLIPQDFDFVPPSQSTPIVQVAVVSQSPGDFSFQPADLDSGAFYGKLHELDSKKPAKPSSGLCKSNTVPANQLFPCGSESTKENSAWRTTPNRRSYRLTPQRRFWKPDKHNNRVQAQQPLRALRGDLNLVSAAAINRKCDSGACDVTDCDHEDIEVIVPPTPAGKTRPSVTLRRRRQTDDGSGTFGSTREEQRGDDAVNCKRTLLDQTLTSPRSETVDEGSLDVSDHRLDDENQTCDWSRDLFSDSV